MARPTKFNEETINKLLQAISVGATYEIAAGYAGIHYDTFNDWMKKGKAGEKPFAEFAQRVKSAEGMAAVKWLAVIDSAAVHQWQAAAWKLERRYPKEYGRQIHEVSGPDGGVIKIEEADDTKREILARLAQFAARVNQTTGDQ